MAWWTKPTLAVQIYALLCVALILAVYLEDKTTMNMIVGAIIAEFARASSYFFGSSDSSQKKDLTIAEQSAALAMSTPPATIVGTEEGTAARPTRMPPEGLTT